MVDYLKSGWQLGKGSFSTIVIFIGVLLFLGYTIGMTTGTQGSFGLNTILILFAQVFAFRAYKLSQSGRSLTFKYFLEKDTEFGLSWGKFGKTLAIQSLLLLGLYLLLIIPGIIFSVYWTFGLFAAVDDKGVGKSALDYSKNIITTGKLSFWTVFGVLFVLGLTQNVLVLISMMAFPPGLLFNIIVSGILAFSDVYIAFVLLSMYLKSSVDNQQPPQPVIQAPLPQPVTQVKEESVV